MAGRKPKPTGLKLVQGTARADRIHANEPKPKPLPPKHPAYLKLNATAKRVFRDVLKVAPWITEADYLPLAELAQAVADWGVANGRKNKNAKMYPDYGGVLAFGSMGQLTMAPELRIMRAAEVTINKMSVELGLTPSARSRINLPEGKSEDELEEFMNRGRKAK